MLSTKRQHFVCRILPSLDRSAFSKATVTITDAFNALRPPIKQDRDERLLGMTAA